MTPRSRSMYAFVGESIQAFQSPAKDLMGINTRLGSSAGVGSDLTNSALKQDKTHAPPRPEDDGPQRQRQRTT